jgi:hypothetical protein
MNTQPLPGSEQQIGRYQTVATLADGTLVLRDTLLNVTIRLTPQESCTLWDYLLHIISFIESQKNANANS